MSIENESTIINVKEKYHKLLKDVEMLIEAYESSHNGELLMAVKSLITERDESLIIINALEKQIPYTPTDKKLIRNYDENFTGKCKCGINVYEVSSYCNECGQKLNWRD